jgi:tRNA dimethylallyltransferase
MSFNLITILGPTATGKTKLAARLAYEFNGEIISADSRQVYKGMDIGTGKDLSDYVINSTAIPYHIIDVIEPGKEFNLFLFTEFFNKVFSDIISRNKTPFLVGGTGLYLSAVLQKYKLKKADFIKKDEDELNSLSMDELREILLSLKLKIHNKTDLEHKGRLIKAILIEKSDNYQTVEAEIKSLVIGVKYKREEIRDRITERLKRRLETGMIDEVKKLVDSGVSFERLISLGLEYKYISHYLKEEMNYDDMFGNLNTSIHHFAKRQMTWFRKMEREGVKINWIDEGSFSRAKELITKSGFVYSR